MVAKIKCKNVVDIIFFFIKKEGESIFHSIGLRVVRVNKVICR